ncbi:expressed unknown protein [Seminavis robusta]|uniref:Uncharacterized protein n=1 Tax=Seminavis robusta TaxID=568900 RepID=A0A9N8DF02_9STRA|nr:expressed unknown protein [Seminavis robusta]|eukprot:Sro93_g048240.1 n/a (233) ;mRNA; r:3906-4604
MEDGSNPPYLAVLRHSVRLDMVEEDGEDDVPWPDRQERPWDTPITDYDLPRTVLKAALPQNHEITAIYSSPFRRCLQTAAVAALHLDIAQILVHRGLGEVMGCVRNLQNGDKQEDDYLMTGKDCEQTVQLASGGKVTMKSSFLKDTTTPPWNETYSQSAMRLGRILRELQRKHAAMKQSVLVVTHGDALEAAARAFLGPPVDGVYDLDFCAMMVLDANQKLVSHHGLKLLEL